MSFIGKLFSAAFGGDGDGSKLHPAPICPECGSQLGGDNKPCPNPDCPAQVRRWLAHWCAPEVMDVPGADARLIALLVERGLVRNVAELYRLKVKELAALSGMDAAAAQKIFDALTASLKREAWRMLVGLNLPLVGAAEAQALLRGFATVDAVFAAGAARLMRDAGVSEAVAQSVVRWHGDSVNRKLVRRLEKFGLNFKA